MDLNYKKVGKNRYELEKTPGMRVAARFYANEKLLPLITFDRSLEQLSDTAKLPDLVSPVLGMPDMHEGYGIPVGGVMACEKLVSPGCVGMDINCGVRLLRTGVKFDEKIFDERGLRELVRIIEEKIPMGLGGEYQKLHRNIEFERIITDGAVHLVENGYGNQKDLEFCEERGKIKGADSEKISKRAKNRAKKQIGTLGSGNHFLELQKVSNVYDETIAETFGLKKNSICIMIHSGSRALGHQTCLDYTKACSKYYKNEAPELVPSKNLASAYVDNSVGKDYLSAMAGSINFAFANRQMMTQKVREAFTGYLKSRGAKSTVEVVYDVAHNSAKWENHRNKKLLIHRKGATRALPPGHPDNPKKFSKTGHPAFIPGSMGTASYVLVGTKQADETYYSVNHGAGRSMSRKKAKQTISKEEFKKQMEGIVLNRDYIVVADEAPSAYKNVEEVVMVLEEIGITKRVVQLTPLAVLKGD